MVDRDELLARVDLAALADELLGGHRGNGRSARWPSPVQGHPQTGKSPPMSIYLDRHGTQRWTCFATGTHGTAIDLVTTVRQCDVRDAIDWLADHTNTLRRDPVPPSATRLMGDPDPVIHTYLAACEQWLWTPAGVGPRRWLEHARHLAPALTRVNRFGFDPGRRHLDRPDGLPHGPGIVIPTLTETGDAIYLQVRNLRPDARLKYTNPAVHLAANPKIHWPQPVEPVDTRVLYVCEGAIDALTVTGHGRRAVALLSAAYTSPAIAAMLAQRPERLVVALDNDPAGRDATRTLLNHLAPAGRTNRVTVLDNGDARDLNALAAEPDRLRELLDGADARDPPHRASSRAR